MTKKTDKPGFKLFDFRGNRGGKADLKSKGISLEERKKQLVTDFLGYVDQSLSGNSSPDKKSEFTDLRKSEHALCGDRLGTPERIPLQVGGSQKEEINEKEAISKRDKKVKDRELLAKSISEAQDIGEDKREDLKEKLKSKNEYLKKLREKKLKRAKNLKPIEYVMKEVVIDKNGKARQAGADQANGEWIDKLRIAGERSLYFFLKGVLNRFFLTPHFHRDVCNFLQTIPAFRKLVMMPREHAKTAIVSGGLPLHIIIQPAATNIYFPGFEGCESRILLAGETMKMAKKNLRVLESVHTNNVLFRALWPHRVWENPRRQSSVWNAEALIFPRENEWPDPTIWAIGVDGAVTGSRPNVMIKDDLVSFAAAQSSLEMETAIQWHRDSRALLDSYEIESGLQSLEFIIGTKWAVYDLYSEILEDLTVEVIDEKYWSIIKDGKILWPEKHTEASIAQLQQEHKHMFPLLYLNSALDPELTDFDLNLVREFKLIQGNIIFDKIEEDRIMEELETKTKEKRPRGLNYLKKHRNVPLTPELLKEFSTRAEYFRMKVT